MDVDNRRVPKRQKEAGTFLQESACLFRLIDRKGAKMPRVKRILYPGAIYHIFNRGNNKQETFEDAQDYQVFLKYLRQAKEKYKFKLFSYALMTNHFHLLLQLEDFTDLGEIMQAVCQPYVFYFNARQKHVGHLFQGRYKAYLVEKETYLLKLTQYIHLNPVKAGFVIDPRGYPWSSCPLYFTTGPVWFERNEILHQFGSSLPTQMESYWVYLQAGMEHFIELLGKPYVKRKRFLGFDDFVNRYLSQAGTTCG